MIVCYVLQRENIFPSIILLDDIAGRSHRKGFIQTICLFKQLVNLLTKENTGLHVIYHQDPQILRIQDPESWKLKDRQFSRIWGSWILRISNGWNIWNSQDSESLNPKNNLSLNFQDSGSWIFRIKDPWKRTLNHEDLISSIL